MTKDGKQKIRLMLVDDHPLVRRGLAELISDEPHLEVCAQMASAEDALQEIDQINPDLVIVDVTLPGMNGVELIKRLRSRFPKMLILVSSMHDESLFAERCLRAGANRLKPFEESPIIPLVAKDLLPPISAGHGTVDCTRKLNA